MICFKTKGSGKKTRCESTSGQSADDSSHEAKERPVAIYSRKFSESGYGCEKMFYNNKRATLYKTEMCRSFSETGTCKYGDNCQFCHSEAELRNVERHPKYKTEICRTFWLEGSCPYGKRCCFAHLDNEELIEKSKKHNALQKQGKPPKHAEHAQLSSFTLSIDDTMPAHCEESCSIPKSEYSHGMRQVNARVSEDILSQVVCQPTDISKPSPQCVGTSDIFSNNTKFEPTTQSRNGAFTFNKYYESSFEPLVISKPADKVGDRQNTWSLNKVNKWRKDPLNFILEDKE